MYDLFLNKGQKRKQELFIELYNSQRLTLSELSQLCSLSLAATKKYIDQLNQELALIGSKLTICKKANHQYYCSKSFPSFTEINKKLIFLYAQHSVSFQICQLLIELDDISIMALSLKLNISVSHTYRSIRQLNEKLERFNLQVKNNHKNQLEFEGQEIDIRVFMFQFLTTCIPNDRWLFPSIPKNRLHYELQLLFPESTLDSVNTFDFFTYFAIIKKRISKRKFLVQRTPKSLDLLSYYTFLSEEAFKDCHFFNALFFETNAAEIETLYISFFVRILFPNIISQEKILSSGKKLSQSKEAMAAFFVDILHSFKEIFTINMPQNHYYKLLYECVLIYNMPILINTNVHYVWNIDFITLKTKYIDDQLMAKIVHFLVTSIEKCKVKAFDKAFFYENQFDYLANLLYLEASMFMQISITICLDLGRDIVTKKFIKNRLQSFFNSDLIIFTNDVSNADLIISDAASHNTSTLPTIFVKNLMDNYLWNNILRTIQELILAKMQKNNAFFSIQQ
ncbi:hypothetical protein GIX45_16745 [Erwinia sp. CPCC 100877]|nr:hypothetical protein [Erwinia sp. CPCC 100877]